MSYSLLAHLYNHIRGSQEDIATISLQYICSLSDELNNTFGKILTDSLHKDFEPDIHYICQSAGDKKERPDLSGMNSAGKERILCEAKFYAGLTSNQPNAYLDRLKKENGLGLVFICPKVRKETLWSNLLDLCKNREITKDDKDFYAEIDGVGLSIITWDEIIKTLRKKAQETNGNALSDIDQLDGFCQQMDNEAFIPFSSEELGALTPRLEERYYQVVDGIFNRIMSKKELMPSAKGLKATAYRQGYVRYLRIENHPLGIIYDRAWWRNNNSVETPFWVKIHNKNWAQPERYQQYFHRFKNSEKEVSDGIICLPLYPPVNVSIDDVIGSLTDQILKYVDEIDQNEQATL